VGCEDVDSIDLAQDRDRRRAVVNEVTKFQVPINSVNLLTI
jgi:hypothetical protein